MIILSQVAWSPVNAAQLHAHLKIARADAARQSTTALDHAPLILLPHSPDIGTEAEAFAALSDIARDLNVYLAGSAVLAEAAGLVPQTLGFLFDPSGEQHLRVGKITPDLVEGFGETKALPAKDATFPVARLPFASIGILPGEDILFAQYARALAFHGAEIILNPSIERADRHTTMRRNSRYGRATDICGYVACATPRSLVQAGTEVSLPTSTSIFNWECELIGAQGGEDFIYYDLDIETLRRRRATPQSSMPAIVRANLYGAGYKAWAEAAGALPEPQSRAEWLEAAQQRLKAEAKRCGPKREKYEEQYDVLAMQTVPRLVPLGIDVSEARRIMMRNLDDNLAQAGARANLPSVRLVVFPEFWLTGPGGIGGIQRTVQDMEKMAITQNDPIIDRIKEFAKTYKSYVAFQNFECHEKLPGRVFNSAFLVSDQGELVHTYRKMQCADVWGFLPDTTPGSIYDQYIEAFGYDALFPVADTPIGMIANMICFDNMSPEIAYGLRRMGAEVILHSSSEPHGAEGRAPWNNARQLRAFENCAYVVSAMDGGEHVSPDSEHLTFFRRGHTRIINFDGTVQGTADGPGPIPFRGHIDLTALRRMRADPRTNFAIWNDQVAYADIYNGEVGFPNNLWAEKPYENPYLGANKLRAVINSYHERGIYIQPSSEIGADRYRTSDTV
ncbi:MAG TPA: nitrilase-related carbon-nitrogen hydrolase [Pedomonas sp.]|uniref:nitrilase-related carbon-nitrogen hydrolase n=1 Tax=Pedomonas sp. TaxID=2976421 RepID=UPI002F40E4D5